MEREIKLIFVKFVNLWLTHLVDYVDYISQENEWQGKSSQLYHVKLTAMQTYITLQRVEFFSIFYFIQIQFPWKHIGISMPLTNRHNASSSC